MQAAVVFDLDGTLIDSLADLAQSVNRMLADVGHDPLPDETIKGFVGNGLPTLVERAMTHCAIPMDRHVELTQSTLAHYNAAPCEHTRCYPGVTGALTQLRDMGHVLAVCTNKPESPARHVLEALNLSPFFDVVTGGDTLPTRKPDPQHLLATYDAMDISGPLIFVGDSEVDAETGRRAGVPFLLFTEGYRKSPIEKLPHSASYNHSSNLPELVRDLMQQDPETVSR
ncbi:MULTISPECIES: phosphoglycolate phosphatase [unclassified Ruegeria]|uniref:phosphoglycolate phosphatase n=1 Tax=unclassified Ruegeria TaxID=2625375 RepID=UPI0014881456|nr:MULTISPECIES: phosphoglycolate phosphatase [unclassified Ruegeria]